ncbi:MAG: helix-turn-helix domain-containing protein [Thalassovita sp.]
MVHPIDVHVGVRIRQRRWMVGMTQQQLAGKVGIKFQQVQKYETGANRVSASRLWRIAKAMEVSVGHFFEGLEPADDAGDGQAPDEAAILSQREAQELLRAYYAIPAEQRRHLLELARAMSNSG